MVPVQWNKEPGSVARCHFLEGGGDIDYTGKEAVVLRMTAPSRPGKYYLFATLISTSDDVKRIIIHLRTREALLLWSGTVSTPPFPIEVVEKQNDAQQKNPDGE